jgi:hypothetical protein
MKNKYTDGKIIQTSEGSQIDQFANVKINKDSKINGIINKETLEEITEELSMEVSVEVPKITEELSTELSVEIPEELPTKLPVEIPKELPTRLPEEITERIPVENTNGLLVDPLAEITEVLPKKKIRKGLMIGINYVGTSSELNGCINDQDNLKGYLQEHKYMLSNELILMNDNLSGANYPTKQNILNQIDGLVNFANNENNKDQCVYLLLAYSGHGSNIYDYSQDEADGKDEVLCPVDYRKSGCISDDVIKSRLVDKLHSKVKLVILMDCCHSGTIIDLQYKYTFNSKNQIIMNTKVNANPCDVVVISGCMDSQTSADAYILDGCNYEYQGAMTASFLACYKDNINYNDLVKNMRMWLKTKNYKQIPQLSSSKILDLNSPHLLTSYN